MHFSEYLAGLTPVDQHALTNNLTVGCGRVAQAVRLHGDNPRTTTMLGTLAVAHAALKAALTTIDPGAAAGRRGAPTVAVEALPQRWEAVLTRVSPDTVEAWLQMATQMALSAAAATLADAEITTVRDHLADVLDALATIRDDTLGH